jgi:hypothetical protein
VSPDEGVELVVVLVWSDELADEGGADVAGAALELGVGAGAGGGELGAVVDVLGAVEARGSMYCWLPADCASAAGVQKSARAADSASPLHT